MGRGKIEIKRIENTSNRQVTYSKRKNGIIKKAKEIAILCDAQVSLVMFSSSGKMHEYCTPSTSLDELLDKYHKRSGKSKLWDAKHENLSNEIDRIKKENDNMQIQLRHLRGEDIASLPHTELAALEEALENGLASNRDKKQNMMEAENERLRNVLHKQELDMEGGKMENNGYHQQMRDYQAQMMAPFGFRVQPIQPNLQERFSGVSLN